MPNTVQAFGNRTLRYPRLTHRRESHSLLGWLGPQEAGQVARQEDPLEGGAVDTTGICAFAITVPPGLKHVLAAARQ